MSSSTVLPFPPRATVSVVDLEPAPDGSKGGVSGTPHQAATDAAVGVAFADGQEWALEEAYRRWGSLIHAVAQRATGSPHDADDIAQAVFVSAWRGRHRYTPGLRSSSRLAVGHHEAPNRRPLGFPHPRTTPN